MLQSREWSWRILQKRSCRYAWPGLAGLQEIVEAQVGDKTLVDTLAPAVDVLKKAAEEGTDFLQALEDMKAAAKKGMESTKDMVAKFEDPAVWVKIQRRFGCRQCILLHYSDCNGRWYS